MGRRWARCALPNVRGEEGGGPVRALDPFGDAYAALSSPAILHLGARWANRPREEAPANSSVRTIPRNIWLMRRRSQRTYESAKSPAADGEDDGVLATEAIEIYQG